MRRHEFIFQATLFAIPVAFFAAICARVIINDIRNMSPHDDTGTLYEHNMEMTAPNETLPPNSIHFHRHRYRH